jgi:hypothetical protein
MSQIFYSEVDLNLQNELNRQARAGRYSRTTKDLAFMLEKICNVQLTAYNPVPKADPDNPGSTPLRGSIIDRPLAVLGGKTTQSGRYLPSGRNGFLNSSQSPYENRRINIKRDDSSGKLIAEQVFDTESIDNSRRIAPYITIADVTIGDGAIGALNKASVNITIPNPDRDLNEMESIWMRPGRYVSLRIQHPESAIIGDNKQLTPFALPDDDKLKKLYPSWANNLENLKTQIGKMNQFDFNGLITNFDMSFQSNGSVDITIQMTGTSDIYTDITMLMDPSKKAKAQESSRFSTINTAEIGTEYENIKTPYTGSAYQSEFYIQLSNAVDSLRDQYNTSNNIDSNITTTGIMPFSIPVSNQEDPSTATDHFILFGQPFDQNIARNFDDVYEPRAIQYYTASVGYREEDRPDIEDFEDEFGFLDAIDIELYDEALATYESGSAADIDQWYEKQDELIEKDRERQKKQFEAEEKLVQEITDDNRYITLGGLIHFLNNNIVIKQPNTNGVGIICTDGAVPSKPNNPPSTKSIQSTYYPELKSLEPERVLILPNKDLLKKPGSMNSYGDIVYYKNVLEGQANLLASLGDSYKEWPGVYDGADSNARFFPSRIFINLETIESIVKDVSNNNVRKFTVGKFLGEISSLISKSTGGAINLVLTADKDDPETILFADTAFIKLKTITPYEIPMFANHPQGTIVEDFQLAAKLPESVKNLSYVLNQGPNVDVEKVAPYMNFMFNADNTDAVQKQVDSYAATHKKSVAEWKQSATEYGKSPQDADVIANLQKTLKTYLQYPTDDIRKSMQLTAPIFPFDASFTISGINGFRYGDVLSFPGLPKKYTNNTVFSIIKINHTVSSTGEWKTKINTIMRPNIP